MRAGGQSSPSLSHLPNESVRSVYSSSLGWLQGAGGTEISNQKFCSVRDLNPEPLDWQSSTLITRLSCYFKHSHKTHKSSNGGKQPETVNE